jgi:hypothetical protein
VIGGIYAIQQFSNSAIQQFRVRFLITSLATAMILITMSCNATVNKNDIQNNAVLIGSSISASDQRAGVTQASPGIEDSCSDSGSGLAQFFSGSQGSDCIPPDKSLLKFKLMASETVLTTDKGLVHLLIEYRKISSLISFLNNHHQPGFQNIYLTVDSVEVYKKHSDHNDRHNSDHNDKPFYIYHPNAEASVITINSNRHYIPFVRDMQLPEGEYSKIKVKLKKEGIVIIDDTTDAKVKLNRDYIEYDEEFQVKTGKITSLQMVPESEWKDHDEHNHEHGSERMTEKSQDISEKNDSDHHNHLHDYNIQLNLKELGSSIHEIVNEVYITMISVSAVNSAGDRIILNETKTVFELLSLRDGAVALMANNMVPDGKYKSFVINIDGLQRIKAGNSEYPVIVEYELQKDLFFTGPFELRGGRITEVLLTFDSASSIFYTEQWGYILDPTIKAISVLSMTESQDLRFRNALGARSNLVAAESELIFEGTVNGLNYTKEPNVNGQNMIYTNAAIHVDDRLRGEIDESQLYPLKVIGGNYEGKQLRVTGMPEFSVNDRSLFFLKHYNNRIGFVRGEMGKIQL